MIYYKKLLLLLFIITSVKLCFGQGSAPQVLPLINKTPPSPTAAALGDYANINYAVESYTGMAPINIPLYTLSVKGFDLPVSLSYNPRGIKVNETSSWVGLGWSLNAGGVITRSVRGRPDDQWIFGGPGRAVGFMNSGVVDSIKNITNEDTYANANRIGNIYDKESSLTLTPGADTEPDIYAFNFNGLTGKFLFGDDHKIKLIPYQNLDIKYILNSDKRISQFTVTDEKGISYVFSDAENTTNNSSYNVFLTTAVNSNNGGNSSSTYISAWYLSKVILPNAEEIIFSYADESTHIQYANAVTFRNCPDGDCEASVNAKFNYPSYAASVSDGAIQGKRLIKIESNDVKIDLEAGADRSDLVGSKPLSSIKVYAKIRNNASAFVYKFIKGYSFGYSYNIGDNHQVFKFQRHPSDYNDYSRRLMLRAVTEVNVTNNPLNAGYKFEYNESSVMPNRFSPEQDFWGYYNHNGANTMIPALYIYPQDFLSDQIISIFKRTQFSGSELILPGANRNVNSTYITLGVLNKVVYPTTGSIQFEYEPNDFYYLNRNIQGGGLRLKKTTLFDGVDHVKDVIKQFTYVQSDDVTRSSGRLLSLPNFFYIENTFPYEDYYHKNPIIPGQAFTNYIDCRNYAVTDIEFYKRFLTRLMEPRYCLGGSDGLDVGYKEVNEIQTNNGKINYKFSVPGIANQTNDGGEQCDIYEDGYCDGLYTPFASHYCKDFYDYFQYQGWSNPPSRSPDLKGINFNYFYQYPFVESTNYDWNRGLLLSKKSFDNTNGLIKEEKYTYQLYFPQGKTSPTYINALKIGKTANWKLDYYYNTTGTLSNEGSPQSDLYVFAKYQVLTDVVKAIKQVAVNLYDKAGGITSSVENYKYQSFVHPRSTSKQWTDSRGTNWEEQYLYPSDLGPLTSTTQPAKGYSLLLSKHMNPLVWTRKLFTVGSSKYYADGKIVFYDSFNNLILPSFQKELQIASPAPYDNFGDAIEDGDISVDSRYSNLEEYQQYDSGNLAQYKTEKTPVGSSLWGYNKRYIVAGIQNASVADVAYTSFETLEDKGGWDFDNSFYETSSDYPNVASVNAATGRRVYQMESTTVPISKNNLDPAKTYRITLFYSMAKPTIVATNVTLIRDVPGAKMNYCEFEIKNSSSVTIQSNLAVIDELRLYPANAEMTTYTYDPLVGMTSSADAKGGVTYYEYDGFQRLLNIKDYQGNIIKSFDYNYRVQ